MKLDPNALEALEAVVDRGSVAGAAAALNKAQSAISYHLRRLEEQLGIAVLDRSGYRLRLTPEGEAILSEARPLLRKLDELGEYGARFRSGWEPELKIYFDGALPTETIASALSVLEAQGAPTRIDLRVGFLDGVQEDFRRQNGHVLIAAIMDHRPDLVVRGLPPLDFVLCCSSGHPLATGAEVPLAALLEHTELIIPNRKDQPALPAHFFGSSRVFYLSDFHTKLAAIRQGLGFGWLPRYMAEPGLASGELAAISSEYGNSYQLTPVIATWSGSPPGKAAALIIDYLRTNGWKGPAREPFPAGHSAS